MLGIGTAADIHYMPGFLPSSIIDSMRLYVKDADTPWSTFDLTSHPDVGYEYLSYMENVDDAGQRSSVVLLNGRSKVATLPPFVGEVQSVLSDMFGNARIIRFKFNILSSRDVEHHKHNIPHCDERVAGYWSMVVYLDGSVGDTVFFKQTLQQLDHTHKLEESKRITPQPGSVVIFPSRLMHASSSPWDGQDRVVANIVFSVV